MKLIVYLICLCSVMTAAHSFDFPRIWTETDPIIKEGHITDYKLVMGSESDEYFYYLVLDGTSRWEFVNSKNAPDLNWKVGDQIKIFFDPNSRQHSAENLNKQNWTYLIRLR